MSLHRSSAAILLALVLSVCVHGAAQAAPQRLFDFSGAAGDATPTIVNDGVMGGMSSSTATIGRGTLVFSGRVRLENNGGFASLRLSGSARADKAVAGARAVRLRVRGDGRPYQFTIQTPGAWYWAPFVPKAGVWQEIDLPLRGFEPRSRFGEPIGAPRYDGEIVDNFGFMVSNKKAERFRLEIDWIGVV